MPQTGTNQLSERLSDAHNKLRVAAIASEFALESIFTAKI